MKRDLQATLGFFVSYLGKWANHRLTEKLRPLALRPNHCGLLAAAATLPSASQIELGQALGVGASALVPMIDHLERLGALRRVSDPENRRRYNIELTRRGHKLLERSAKMAEELDAEMLAGLTSSEATKLNQLVQKMSNHLAVRGRERTSRKRP